MIRLICLAIGVALSLSLPAFSQEGPETDIIKTSAGDLEITFVGHGTLMMQSGGKVIHVDPFSSLIDYRKLPKADLVLITHHHGDHLDMKAIELLRTEKTIILLSAKSAEKVKGGTIMKNGDVQSVLGVKVEAVPAYNIVQKRPDGSPFHPKGEGNGYILTFGKTRIYIAGDTENTPEMKGMKDIDIAFLPMNLPYTMTPAMVADAAKAFRPKVLYPYHYGETDPGKLVELMEGTTDVEIRIRKMK